MSENPYEPPKSPEPSRPSSGPPDTLKVIIWVLVACCLLFPALGVAFFAVCTWVFLR